MAKPKQTGDEGVVRIGPVVAIPDLLQDFGVDPREALAEAGLEPSVFDDPDTTIPFTRLGRLFSICVARTGCNHFGLLVGQRAGASNLGLVGFLMQHSPDVGSALRNLVLHLHLHDRGAVPTLATDAGSAMLGYAIYRPEIEAADQIADGTIAIGCNIMRKLCGPEWRASVVLLAHRPPSEVAPFRKFFGAPLRFDAEQNALVFPVEWLERPLSGADPELHRMLRKQVDDLETRHGGDFPDQVRRVLRTSVLTRQATADEVAALFSVHSRTLNRRLQACGTSFQELADQCRYGIARQMLADSGVALSQVAAALDYADASAFTRAFKRWSGTTPALWRVEQRIRPSRRRAA
jgi:AraC-like DNA-binding protein